MINLIAQDLHRPLEILCIGAHGDDIEIGCGGTLRRLLEEAPGTRIRWIVLSAAGRREAELKESVRGFLRDAGESELLIGGFRDSFFPYVGEALKEYFEKVVRLRPADVIFTHCRDDLHQDHRLVAELTWNTFRNTWILEYEIPKYDGDLGRPNLFVPLEERFCRDKIETILRSYASQRDKQWFSEDTFLALLRLRGIESASPTGFAEAFTARKITWAGGGPGGSR